MATVAQFLDDMALRSEDARATRLLLDLVGRGSVAELVGIEALSADSR